MANSHFIGTNPNLNHNYANDFLDFDSYLFNNPQEFDVYAHVDFDGPNNFDSTSSFSNGYLSRSPVRQELASNGSVDRRQGIIRDEDDNDDGHHVVSFRLKTELEILDDGYKWRKYGKKKVKTNSNPRYVFICDDP
ncbi:hypothetical protein Leryth_022871 [Lithospermum erythrorhizon]|nr:hypothetical protein Leryth_022871 [Lithospermum erythrorhizon]